MQWRGSATYKKNNSYTFSAYFQNKEFLSSALSAMLSENSISG